MVRHNLTDVTGLKWERVLGLARKQGMLRPRDVKEVGISGEYLNKLHHEGLLERVGRGLYRLPDKESSKYSQLAEVAKRVPKAVFCLLSALDIHELTTEIPHQLWIGIPVKDRTPRIDYPPVKVIRFSDASMSFGVETRIVDGVTVKVFSPAKTVADCFKFRNQVGLDVAMEALKDSLRKKKATIDELWDAARACRMTNVMRPYMESLA